MRPALGLRTMAWSGGALARCSLAPGLRVRHMSGAGYTMEQVKQMRSMTSAPMKECVKALKATEGNIEEAIAWLRKAGVASAHKKADRQTSDGAVVLAMGEAGIACVEVNTETDFVARNTVFQDLATSIARSCLSLSVSSAGATAGATGPLSIDVAALGASKLASGQAEAPMVSDALALAMTQLGENVVVRRACLLPIPENGLIASYVHNQYSPQLGRIGAAVALASDAADKAALKKLGEQLCMHIVASSPVAVTRDSVPVSRIEREREILVAQAANSGKPAQVVEKMVSGRLDKFFQEVALLEQPFVLDEKGAPVKRALEAASKELGSPVECVGFVRYAVGEAA